ncbi:BatD family protein [Wenyingzhuangia sp. IMCC45574]
MKRTGKIVFSTKYILQSIQYLVSSIQYKVENTQNRNKNLKSLIFKTNYLVLFTLFIATANYAQDVQLIAKVSKKTLAENQRLRISYEINNQEADDFSLPNFKNFEVIQGPMQSISSSNIITNGSIKSVYKKTYTYFLKPKRKGVFIIPPASISYRGDIIKSNAMTIKVVDAQDLPKDPNDPNYLANQNLKMVISVSNNNPYVGEPVYVEYRLYVNVNQIVVSNYNPYVPAKFEGFWSQNIKVDVERPEVKEGKLNGEIWKYVVLNKTLLIPQREGVLKINPSSTEVMAGVPTGKLDFFRNIVTRNIKVEVASTEKKINVKPLPLEGKPLDFSGAVGDYNYSVTTSRDVFKANESAQVKVKVSGRGNIKLFEIPTITTPKELEVYDPERKERVSTATSGLKGSIENAYTVVPQYKGKFIIPKTSFSYFNPEDEKYHTITSDEIVLNVTQGKELTTGTSSDYSNGNDIIKQSVRKSGEDFRYIQTFTVLKAIEKKDFFKSTLFYVLLLLPVVVIPLGLFASKKQRELSKDIKRNKLKKADKLARKYLASAKKELGNKETFYSSLEKALHNYLKAKLSVETTDISKERIEELLLNKNVSNEVVKQFLDVFAACEFARYAPSSDERMKEDFDKAKKAITLIDKNL